MTALPQTAKTAGPATGPGLTGADSAVDPMTLAVVRGRLEQIADEMDTVFERMAFSPVISDAWDRADGIYSPYDGSMIVQGDRGLPIFVGVMQHTVASVIDWARQARGGTEQPRGGTEQPRGGPELPRPGDIYLINDPYLGGTHIMDTKMVRPFFYQGELFAYLANTGHWPDIGGRVPGGFSAAATDCYQEGLRVPPVRLFTDDELNPDILSILQANSRIPDDIIGDVHAQSTALRAGEKRLTELLDEHGAEQIRACVDELSRRAETQMRSHISEIPDGTYRYVELMDNDGITDEPLRVDAALTIAGDRMRIDLSDSSPPCVGPMNSVKAATVSSCLVAVKHVFPDVALNSGMFAPIDIDAPDSTFLNARIPRPVAGCAAETSQRIITAVLGCLHQALPGKVPAGSCATVNNLSMGGVDEAGDPYVMYLFLGGGYGGHVHGDGLSNGCSLMSIGRTQSAEVLEQRYPILFHRYGLREGSSGAGATRGGFGVHVEFAMTGPSGWASLLGDQSTTPPVGRAGGGDGQPSAPWLRLKGEHVVLPMVSKGENVPLVEGDVVCLRTPGGGGYGAPAERPVEDVRRDVADGYLTEAEAAGQYPQACQEAPR
ncbi:MAG: hydantoinase B/oxoprolinase family protein [Micromonosporaceae bacterium]